MPDAPLTNSISSDAFTEKERWEAQTLDPLLKKAPERPIGADTGINVDKQGRALFTSISGTPVERLYAEADLPEDWEASLSSSGEPPYTRGIHPNGYRGKLWTMRQFSGFATPEETNQRYKYLLAKWRQRPLGRLRSAHADGLRF